VASKPRMKRLALWALRHLWLLDPSRCDARSPEGMRCVFQPGHDGTHMPRKGNGWAWGGDYGR